MHIPIGCLLGTDRISYQAATADGIRIIAQPRTVQKTNPLTTAFRAAGGTFGQTSPPMMDATPGGLGWQNNSGQQYPTVSKNSRTTTWF
jgi:hypothetical protein